MRSPYGRPAGVPVGRALVVRPGIVNNDLRDAVAAIDRVHGDGDLPTIPILLVPHLLDDRGRTRDAVFVYHRLDPSQPFIASIIFVRSSAAHRPFVATHEIGHFLDLCGLPGSTFASSEEPALAEWRKSVIESSAYRSLGTLTRSLDATVANR